MLFPLVLAVVVFRSIPRNYFYADDLLAVYETIHKPLLGFFLEPYGGHVFAARNLVYLILYRCFGLNPSAYFLIALLTHLLNVGLLFLIVRDLTTSRLACFSAALWGSAPINQGAIGWYQAYGVVLALTAQLWIVHRLVRVRLTGRLSRLEIASWGILLFAASTCFGTGLAITMAMPGVAWLLLPATAARRRATFGLASIAACVAAGYFILQRVAEQLFPDRRHLNLLIMALDHVQDFFEVAWLMMAHGLTVLLLGPLAHHIAVGSWSEGVIAAAFLASVGAAFAVARADARRLMLACLLSFGIGYLSIAAGRVFSFGGVGMKLIARAHYHYTAPATVAILAALLLVELARRWRPSAALARALVALWFVTFATLQLTVGPPIDHHDTERRLAEQRLAEVAALVRSQPAGSDVFIKNNRFSGVGPLVIKNPQNFPGTAGLFAVYYPDQLLAGRRVFFVEADPRVLGRLREWPFAGMLVAPDTVPADRVLHLPGAR